MVEFVLVAVAALSGIFLALYLWMKRQVSRARRKMIQHEVLYILDNVAPGELQRMEILEELSSWWGESVQGKAGVELLVPEFDRVLDELVHIGDVVSWESSGRRYYSRSIE